MPVFLPPGNAPPTPQQRAQATPRVVLQDVQAGQAGHAPAVAVTNSLRAQLRAHGYDVDVQGAATPRFMTALKNFQKTNGAGSKLWNHLNLRSFVPSTAPGMVQPPVHAAPVGTHVPNAHTPGSAAPPNFSVHDPGLPDTSGVTSGYTPEQIAAMTAQLSKQFAVPGMKLQAPNMNPVKYASAQANMEYGPAIAALLQSLGETQGSEAGAQANISKFFAPVQQQAADATASTDAVANANAASQATLAPGVAASLGLSGSAAGGVLGLGTTQADFAKNLATIMHQQGANAQTGEANQEQMAHSTEQANNTNSLANLRAQLLAQQVAKGNAQSKYQTDANALQQQQQAQYVTEQGALQNQKITGALAIPQIIAAKQGLLGTAQTQQTNAAKLPYQLQGAADAHAQVLSNIEAQKANEWRTLHPVLKSGRVAKGAAQTPWTAVDPGAKENLRQYLRSQFHNSNPEQAYKGILGYMNNGLDYQGGNITKFAQQLIDQYWGPHNPRWGFDPKTGSYVKRK